MRRLFVFICLSVSLLLTSCSNYKVYSVRSKPSGKLSGGMLYALPTTRVKVVVTFEKRNYDQAPYADYAADMLGVEQNKDSVYSIRSIEISGENVADADNYYFVLPKHISVNIDSRNLLLGVGDNGCVEGEGDDEVENHIASKSKSPVSAQYNLYDRADTFYVRTDKPGHPSLVSTKKDVRTVRQRAYAAAERLNSIKNKQYQLLFGDFEGSINTEAVEFMYDRLKQAEDELTAQFLGSTTTESVVFWVEPKDEKTLVEDQTVELFRFSPKLGLVDSTVDNALVVRCNVRCENSLRNASRFVRYRTKSVGVNNYVDNRTFKYRIPEVATVTVTGQGLGADDPVEFSYSKSVKIAQFGTLANLPMGRIAARFDPHTGDLIYFKAE